jgi:general secretion pathway protein A
MYLQAYGVEKSPFNITSDPQIFFESESHKKAFGNLLYGIQQRKGIILITGEVGTGKTTLCNTLLRRLPNQTKTSMIFNPYFSEVQLLCAIIEDFGLNVKKKTRLNLITELNSFLVNISLDGGNAVLIVDEAQDLNNRQLEQIRLLSNLETSESKLLQIVLFGQPELEEKLKQFHLRQIRQRIFIKYHLSPLSEEEVKSYVEFRLGEVGLTDIIILPSAFKIIYEFSQGIPRLINMLCDRALLLGFVREVKVLDDEIFRASIEEIK